jgi:tRNA(Ile)-lysidine synthase
MSSARAPTQSASELIAPPPGAVARFRADVARLVVRGLDGAALADGARIALAVSGGPDSMAMLALAAAAFPGCVIAATFDHRLRAEAAAEAALVARVCAALGVPHTTLTATDPITGSSIQMRAREARYAALARWATAEGVYPLLTAHHADDQAETLLMRLNRASGVAGLAGVRAVRFDDGVMILRPLLDWRRTELRAIVAEAQIPFVDDPSNRDERHDRVRMRTLLAETPGLDPAALAASAAFIAEAEEALSLLAARLWAERWHGADRAFAIGDEPRELRRRLVRRAILDVRHQRSIVLPSFTDSANVEPLLNALEAGKGAVQGGVKVSAMSEGWVFRAAPPRRSL